MITVSAAAPTDLAVAEVYDVLRLRVDVFVVEQACPYPELDGRDLEPGTIWVIARDGDGRLAGTLRVLADQDGRARIGRVATAEHARAAGTGSLMMRHALQVIGSGRISTLDAQAHLQGWYERFGYTVSGPEYVEDGIPHVPMERPAS